MDDIKFRRLEGLDSLDLDLNFAKLKNSVKVKRFKVMLSTCDSMTGKRCH